MVPGCFFLASVKQLTFHIIFCVRIIRFIVVNHLNDLEEIILAKPLQTVRELLHINLVSREKRQQR
jgi:hypothetical protein